MKSEVFSFIKQNRKKYDIIFAGPPYALETIDTIPDLIFEKKLLNPNGWFIHETSAKHSYTNHPRLFHVRNYGGTFFHFFREDDTTE